jgi:hypothetical protein
MSCHTGRSVYVYTQHSVQTSKLTFLSTQLTFLSTKLTFLSSDLMLAAPVLLVLYSHHPAVGSDLVNVSLVLRNVSLVLRNVSLVLRKQGRSEALRIQARRAGGRRILGITSMTDQLEPARAPLPLRYTQCICMAFLEGRT